MGKIAFVFAGQGAQHSGMGLDYYEQNDTAKEIFERAEKERSKTLLQCFYSDEAVLKETRNTQPCMFAFEVAIAQALIEKGVTPDVVAGFSLGELSALAVAGAASFESLFSLVCKRGALMQEAAEAHPTAMAAVVKLSNEEVMVKVIHGGVGAINESDVSLASASNAIIIGFNVRPDATAKSVAEREKVDLRLYRVIYQAIEDVEAAMKGMLDPVFEEKVIGHAVVRQTFKASGVGTIAGAYVMDGKFQRGCSCRITRDGEQIFDGGLASLKRFKDDVKEVATGYECGLVFEKFNDIQEDDMVEAYMMVEVPR